MPQIDDLRYCYAFDKTNAAQREYIAKTAIPHLEMSLRLLKAIRERNDPHSDVYRGYTDEIEKHERAIAEAKTRLADAAGHVQQSLF
jgi:hypothetical protein